MANPRVQSVKVIGLRRVTKEIKQFGDSAVADIKQVHAKTAKIVEDAARPKAPTLGAGRSRISGKPYWYGGPNKSPGSLKGTIRSSGTQRGGYVRAGKKLVPYAGPIHFGWPSRPNPAKGWAGGPIRPNPFIYDALDERRGQVVSQFQRYLDRLQRYYLR